MGNAIPEVFRKLLRGSTQQIVHRRDSTISQLDYDLRFIKSLRHSCSEIDMHCNDGRAERRPVLDSRMGQLGEFVMHGIQFSFGEFVEVRDPTSAAIALIG